MNPNNIKTVSPDENILFYANPARVWTEALPIGNGRLGGMIFGKIEEEQISLNEDTLYADHPLCRTNPDCKKTLPEVRKLLKEGRLNEANMLAQAGMLPSPRYTGPYQPLANLFIRLCGMKGKAKNYIRTLDIANSLAKVEYSLNGVKYTREYFASYPKNAIIIRLTADKPSSLSLYVNLMRRPFDPGTKSLGNCKILMEGIAGDGGCTYDCMVSAVSEGGCVGNLGDTIKIDRADSVTIFVTAATSFRHARPRSICDSVLRTISDISYEKLLHEHIADYRELYDRVKLSLNTPDRSDVPTDVRLAQYKENPEADSGLIELYFNFGRYLLISCSRPGSEAANLQGIWNDSFTPSWESIYTININIEMNYWFAQGCNMPELCRPLFELIKKMYPSGCETARDMYGCRGFVAHHNTNVWGDCAPTGAGVFLWCLGAAWLCLSLWEQYEYGHDIEFLKNEAYLYIRDSALFFIDYLIEDDDGYLITGLTQSPENTYRLTNGESGSIARTCTMDNAIIGALFDAYIGAYETGAFDFDCEFAEKVKKAREKLRPYQIGTKGQLLEWDKEYEECAPGHRHISHLFGLHPGHEISPDKTPELAEACKRTLELRIQNGGGHTGWSRAWLINMYARLRDGENAYKNLQALIGKSTYPNMFDCHPPFQIDGNFGGVSAIIEMLENSAIPADFPNGTFTGLRIKGEGVQTVDLEWKNGIIKKI